MDANTFAYLANPGFFTGVMEGSPVKDWLENRNFATDGSNGGFYAMNTCDYGQPVP